MGPPVPNIVAYILHEVANKYQANRPKDPSPAFETLERLCWDCIASVAFANISVVHALSTLQGKVINDNFAGDTDFLEQRAWTAAMLEEVFDPEPSAAIPDRTPNLPSPSTPTRTAHRRSALAAYPTPSPTSNCPPAVLPPVLPPPSAEGSTNRTPPAFRPSPSPSPLFSPSPPPSSTPVPSEDTTQLPITPKGGRPPRRQPLRVAAQQPTAPARPAPASAEQKSGTSPKRKPSNPSRNTPAQKRPKLNPVAPGPSPTHTCATIYQALSVQRWQKKVRFYSSEPYSLTRASGPAP